MADGYNGLPCPSGISCENCFIDAHGFCGNSDKLEIKYDIKK